MASNRRPQAPKVRTARRSDRMRMGAEQRGERYTRSIKHRNRMIEG